MRNRPIPNLSDAQKQMVRDLVLYEDEFLLAFNKPSGLAVQTRGNRGTSLDYLLWAFARSNGKRPHLVHRIDAGTSGLVLSAKTKPAMTFLSAEFAERRVQKRYLALVSGSLPEAKSGVCETPILKVGRAVQPGQVERGADAARTHWAVLSRTETHALIEARPHTGRMHQIRLHLADMGCPILGDPIYGAGTLTAKRLMLHAANLEITLPNQEKRALEAPVPEDFKVQRQALGL
ncbi:MAG: RluA family pseudouridine synthase [Henriciella sp.]|nr:RluA family pseudouridine synthase [Henriciella sp.]